VFAARITRDPLPGHPARSLFLPVAIDDPGFPNPIYTAMALASGVRQAGPVLFSGLQTVLATAGLNGVDAYPARSNVRTVDGRAATGVVVQYPSDGILDGHHIFAQLDAVKHQYGCFLASALAGGSGVVPAPAAIGTGCEGG
jgi:hypothetical protein